MIILKIERFASFALYRITKLNYLQQQFCNMAVVAEGNFWPFVLCCGIKPTSTVIS